MLSPKASNCDALLACMMITQTDCISKISMACVVGGFNAKKDRLQIFHFILKIGTLTNIINGVHTLSAGHLYFDNYYNFKHLNLTNMTFYLILQ